jgi:hypothetical protein
MFSRILLAILLSVAVSRAQSTTPEAMEPVPSVNDSTVTGAGGFHLDPPSSTDLLWETGPAPQTPRPKAISYSNGYSLRRSVHKYASYATLPLFVAQFVVGQKMYDNPGDDSLHGAHSGLAAGTAVLFGVNSFTGVWNLMEGRHDPNRHRRRTVHGILMLAADAGFVATAALAPGEHEGNRTGTSPDNNKSTHRAVALTSMGIATASYLYMLFTR